MSNWDLPEYSGWDDLADWERELARLQQPPTVAELRAMPNAPTHVIWFRDPWWKRTLRRLHLIRKPKPFDWKAAR